MRAALPAISRLRETAQTLPSSDLASLGHLPPMGKAFCFLLLLLRLGYWHAAVLHGRRKDDLRPGAAKLLQVVDELIQLLRRTEQHLYQHTVIAGDAVAFHHMGAALDIGVKLRLALGVHVQIDERLDHVAQLRRVDLCLVAGDGAGAFQPGHAGRHGGAGQKHMVGNFF